jgi:hypothetical protein
VTAARSAAAALLLAVALLPALVASGAAAAGTRAPTPAPAPPVGASADDAAPSGVPDAGGRDVEEVLAEIRDHDVEAAGGGVLGALVGDGGIPWAHYDLGTSVGLFERLMADWMRLTFGLGLSVVALATWVLELVAGFGLGRALAQQVGPVAGGYAELLDVGGALPLRHLALMAAVASAGWQVLRHRAQAAVPELLASLLIAVVGAGLLQTADRAACTGLSVMAELTVGTIQLGGAAAGAPQAAAAAPPPRDWCTAPEEAGAGGPPPLDGEALVAGAFVHEPFLLLQWGVVPPVGSPCRRVADALVERTAWGHDDQPREWVEAVGCTEMAAFNRELPVGRVVGAAGYALAAGAFGVAVALTAGTLLVAQVAGALLVLAMPFAVVAGIAPGVGRELLARWVHAVLKVAVLFLGSGFVLSFLVSAVAAVQAGTEDQGLLVRVLSSVAVAWSVVLLRGRVLHGARLAAHGLARSAAGGRDVGPAARGVAAVAADRAYVLADAAATAHAGAIAAGAVRGRFGARTAASAPATRRAAGPPPSPPSTAALPRHRPVGRPDGGPP